MKKGIIISAVVLVLTLVTVLLCRKITGREMDVTLESSDFTAVLTFSEATKEEPERVGGFSYRFKLTDSKDFYTAYIADNPYVLYSVSSLNEVGTGENDGYLLLINRSYFFVEKDSLSGWYRYSELANYLSDEAGFYITPVRNSSHYEEDGQSRFYSWDNTVGLHSFEELVGFYSRLPEQFYEADEKNRTIYTATYHSGEWGEKLAVIRATDEGIYVSERKEVQ